MPDGDLTNLEELLKEIEGISINTSQGSYVKVDDLKKLMDKRAEARQEAAEAPPGPKTVEQARAAIKRDPDLAKLFPQQPQDSGRAIAAREEPQPVSRP